MSLPVVFSLLSDHHQALVADVHEVDLPEGQVILRPGDNCEGFLILTSGEIRVFGCSEDGKEMDLYRIEPEESKDTCILTTSCLLGDQRYPAQAVVEQEARAYLLPKPVFGQLLSESQEFRQFVFQSYAERLTGLMTLVQSVAFEKMEVRLAKILLKERRNSLVLSVSHQDLADSLGTAREVVSRILKQFEREEWVSLARGQIFILDVPALKRLSKSI